MRVIHVTKAGRERSDNPIFVGEVDYQTAVGEESRDLRLSEVHFKRGAVNKPHVHSTDQILVITEGEGLVQSRGAPVVTIRPGDVVHTPPDEWHWHGAAPDRLMTHLSMTEGDAAWGEHVSDADYRGAPG